MADTTTANQLRPLKELPPTVDTVLLTGSADRLVTARDTSEWAALLPTSDRLSRDGGHQLLLHGGFATIGDWLTKHAP
jgi:hypothetical protein